MNRVRHAAIARNLAAIPPPENAISAALTTGERRAIPPDVIAAARHAGLVHLPAISGLHFALVAGLLFGGLRTAIACIPSLALRYPIEKWAPFGAFNSAFRHLLISGASIPTQRVFLMLGIVLLSVILDRASISMRLVAAAAILLIARESILGASFQLSFAAVVLGAIAIKAKRCHAPGRSSSAGHAIAAAPAPCGSTRAAGFVRSVSEDRGLRPWTAGYRRLNRAGTTPRGGPAP